MVATTPAPSWTQPDVIAALDQVNIRVRQLKDNQPEDRRKHTSRCISGEHMRDESQTGSKPQVAALEGWFTLDAEQPHLLGSKCASCGTYYFPKQQHYCKNPGCEGESFDEVKLSRTGVLWSFTNACYQPPEPFVAADPYRPFAIAAVKLEKENMVVLGQVAEGVDVEQLKAGLAMELVLETLFEDNESEKLTWKWNPVSP